MDDKDKPKGAPPTTHQRSEGPVTSAPYGIAISGGTVSDPTVNNFVTPNTVTQYQNKFISR